MATALETAEQDLVEVRARIADAQGMQSYGMLGRSVARADLATLYAERDRLEEKIARLTRGGRRIQRAVPL